MYIELGMKELKMLFLQKASLIPSFLIQLLKFRANETANRPSL